MVEKWDYRVKTTNFRLKSFVKRWNCISCRRYGRKVDFPDANLSNLWLLVRPVLYIPFPSTHRVQPDIGNTIRRSVLKRVGSGTLWYWGQPRQPRINIITLKAFFFQQSDTPSKLNRGPDHSPLGPSVYCMSGAGRWYPFIGRVVFRHNVEEVEMDCLVTLRVREIPPQNNGLAHSLFYVSSEKWRSE